MTADGRVDMDPQSAMIRYCTWAGCPGIEMSVPIVEREHGYSHDICETANQAPFVLADERKRQDAAGIVSLTATEAREARGWHRFVPLEQRTTASKALARTLADVPAGMR